MCSAYPYVQNTVIDCNKAIASFRRSRGWKQGIFLLAEMERKQLEPDIFTYNTELSLCGGAYSEWPQMALLLSEMPSKLLRADVISLGSSLLAFELCWSRAVQQLCRSQVHALLPNLITYNATSTACAKASDWQRASQLLGSLRCLHAVPDIITWNSFCDACDKGAAWVQAWVFLLEARRSAASPDVVTYSSAVSATGRAYAWMHAVPRFLSSTFLPFILGSPYLEGRGLSKYFQLGSPLRYLQVYLLPTYKVPRPSRYENRIVGKRVLLI